MKIIAKEVISYVSDKMSISFDDAQKTLCITDKETIVVMEDFDRPGRYEHVVEHDLDASKVDLKTIAANVHVPQEELSAYVEDNMVWVLYGPNIVEGIPGEGPTPKHAIADFYRLWYLEKVKTTIQQSE